MEENHDFIQWVLPIDETSTIADNVPILDNEIIMLN